MTSTRLALARSPRSAVRVAEAGAEPVTGDLADRTDAAPWVPRLAGVDAVVPAAARMEFWGPDEVGRS